MRTGPAIDRRRRRLRATTTILAAVVVVAVAVGAFVAARSEEDVRRPGEALDEITDRLRQGLPEGAPLPRLVDVTDEVGIGSFVTFLGDRSSQLPEDMGSGAAWGDFDNDGDDDLFLVAAGGPLGAPAATLAPSRLFENVDGRFEAVADFPELRIHGMAAAWADADRDGWLDLVVTGFDTLLLLRNEAGSFSKDPAIPSRPGFWSGAAWGDFDNDRDLDLYVCGYVDYGSSNLDEGARASVTDQYGASVPYTLNPTSFAPARNLLFVNRGDGTFLEDADRLGVADATGRGLSALWHDWNGDGWLDLYVANDISDNALFLNRGDVFEEVGLAALVADYRGAMGLAAGDWNRDGDDDLFITHWVAQENALYDSRLGPGRAPSQDPASSPIPTFSDLSAATGLGPIALPLVGWGTEFVDFDGDGWLDLVVANGSTLEEGTTPRRLKPQPPLLLWNRRGEYFHDLAASAESFAEPHVARGLAVSDFDADGDQDVLIVRLDDGARLFRNDMQTGHWLELELRDRVAEGVEGRGEGATATVWLEQAPLRRSVSGASYLSQSSSILHFGLGDATEIDRVEVLWRGGRSERFSGLGVDARWRITEGEPEPELLWASDTATAGAESETAGLTAERRREFWRLQRRGMDRLKREGDVAGAVPLLEAALAIDPSHEDSRYYLANCLAELGRTDEALEQLDLLRRTQPSSHRGHRQWGVLRALTSRSEDDLSAAAAALERAVELNPEETGALLALGEIDLLRGETEEARERLELACRSNPKAVGGFFLRAYLAWKRGDPAEARRLLAEALAARGDERAPEGSVAEGDVARVMHRDATPLSGTWREWDGADDDLDAVFAPVERAVAR